MSRSTTCRRFADDLAIRVVPVVWRGRFGSVQALQMVEEAHRKPSRLGGTREGVVIRLARAFHETEFEDAVCKSVREPASRRTSIGHETGSPAGWRGRNRSCREDENRRMQLRC